MTTPMHDLFDELATTVPPTVAPPELAQRAYTDGRRRRRARQLRTMSVAAAVVLIAGLVLPTTVAPELKVLTGGDGSKGVDGYPERIDVQWPIRSLPDRPGPIAGLLQAIDEGNPQGGGDWWYAFNENGHRWRIRFHYRSSDQRPSLSQDGRLLGYLEGQGGPYVVRDLVTGRRVEYPEIGQNSTPGPVTAYSVMGQTPGYWSPDGHHLLLWGGRPDRDVSSGLVLDALSGTVSAVDIPGVPYGWSANDRIIWRELDERTPAASIRMVEIDLRGNRTRSIQLRPNGDWDEVGGQWAAAVSPGGATVAIADDSPPGRVAVFSLTTGEQLGAAVPVDVSSPCAMSYGEHLVVPTLRDGVLRAESVPLDGRSTLTTVPKRIGGRCFVWAQDALDGHARRPGLPADTNTFLVVWWRQLLGAGLAAGLVWLLLGVRRRLRRRAASHVLDAS